MAVFGQGQHLQSSLAYSLVRFPWISSLTVFQGFVGSGQVCLVCTFSQLGKSPCLEFRFIFCPRSVFQWGWCRGMYSWPPERAFQDLVPVLHGAPNGSLRGQLWKELLRTRCPCLSSPSFGMKGLAFRGHKQFASPT